MPRPCSSAPSTILSIRELCSYIGEMGSIGWADFALFGDFATYIKEKWLMGTCTDEILILYVNSAKNSLVIVMRLYFLVICV